LAQTASIQFDSVFVAPIVRAQFDVLLVLAEAIAPSLPDLYRAATNWNRVVIATAEAFTRQIDRVQTIEDANAIWGQVLLDLDVRRLAPASAAVVKSITARLETALAGSYDGAVYLAGRHTAAVQWVRGLGGRRGIASLASSPVYPIRVHYNPKGDDYCASSSLYANEIGWNLQLVERSLYGVLILDMLFAHEYLSHMLPKNNFLSKNVREIWLSAALYWEYVDQLGDNAAKQVTKFLWEKFRRELSRQFDPKDLEFFGPLELDHLAEHVRFTSDEVFWDISKAMLECLDERKNAEEIDRFLRRLLNLSSHDLRAGLALRPPDWDVLREFYQALAK
jgi:hypothetical protein